MIGDLFQLGIGVIRTVIAETGAVMAQTGDPKAETVEADNVAWWQHVGYISRPPKAAPKQTSCEAILIRGHGTDYIIASRDLRGLELAGTLEEGETCIYAAGADGTGQARILLKANGNIAAYTTQGNVEGGTAVTMQCNSDGELHMGGPYGGLSVTADALTLAHVDGAAIKLDSGGITQIGQAIALNGGSVSLGANATMPVVWGAAGIAGVGSTSVKVAI